MVQVRLANQLRDLRELLTLGGEVSIAVAYLRCSGLNLIRDEFKTALIKGRARVLVSLDGRVTEPEALQQLVELTGECLEVRYFDIPSSEHAIFHPKLYIFESGDSTTFLTGSYNLTGAALERNREHGLRITCKSGEREGQDALEVFEALWSNELSKTMTAETVERYRRNYQKSAQVPHDELWAEQALWLLKCDTATYTFDSLAAEPGNTDTWGDKGSDGPKRDTRSALWDAVKVGDRALFYEFGGRRERRAVGIVEVLEVVHHQSEAYRRPVFCIRATEKFERPVTLQEIRDIRRDLGLAERNERLSLDPVSEGEWRKIIDLGQPEGIQ